jgi:hypothetical protein
MTFGGDSDTICSMAGALAGAFYGESAIPGTRAGVDVMITIFCDFCKFSAKILTFFSKTNVMIKFLHNLALL